MDHLSINDQQTQMLEAYLDGELSTAERAEVESRLAESQTLSARLAGLRMSRELRVQSWQSLEPVDSQVGEGIWQAIDARESRRRWFHRILDYRSQIATAAACIAVFLMGWQWGRNVNAMRLTSGGSYATQPVRLITQEPVAAEKGGPYSVRILDSEGNLVRQEFFQTSGEAQAFIQKFTRR